MFNWRFGRTRENEAAAILREIMRVLTLLYAIHSFVETVFYSSLCFLKYLVVLYGVFVEFVRKLRYDVLFYSIFYFWNHVPVSFKILYVLFKTILENYCLMW